MIHYGVCVVLLCIIPIAYAQSMPPISVQIDSDVYGPGQTIRMWGVVDMPHGGAVTIQVISPTGAVVAAGQAIPEGRDWSYMIPAEFSTPGTFTILVHYTLGADTSKRDSATFAYTRAVEGTVSVNGTIHLISYTGDVITSAYTDHTESLLYLELEGAGSGVLRLSPGLAEGMVVAVSGGDVQALPDGSYAYNTDGTTLVLAADAVAVPEFGMAVVPAAAVGVPALLYRLYPRLHIT